MNTLLRKWLNYLRINAQAFGLASVVQATAQANTVIYTLDPAHTSIHWTTLHLGTSTLRGRLRDIEGHIELDAQAGTGVVSMTIPLESINTGIPPLDSRLRSPQFFDTKRYPVAYFVSRQIQFKNGQPATVQGELTAHGQATGVTLRATHFNCYTHPERAKRVCGGDFEGELLRSSLGLADGVPLVADRVRLFIQIEATQRDTP